MIVFGHAYYGHVDWVPGLFYVKTRFLHFWWIPFAPCESWVVADDGRGERGHRIRLSWKSVLVTWSRTFLGCLLVFSGMMFIPIYNANPKQMTVHPLVAAGAIVAIMLLLAGLYALTYRWAKARRNGLSSWQ